MTPQGPSFVALPENDVQTLLRSWRSWKRAKAIAALAAVALAVGTGSSTAIFTVVNAVMLRPLPYSEGDRWVALYGASAGNPSDRSSHRFPHLREYQRRTASFDVFGWFTPKSFNLTSPGAPQHVNGAAVTLSLAQHLGVNPAMGTWFRDESGVVISQTLWRRLGADPALVGKPLTLNGRIYTLTGVMPSGFRLPLAGAGGGRVDNDVWTFLDPAGRGQNPDEGFYFSYARRKAGVTLLQAEADVKRVAAAIVQSDSSLPRSYTARLDDLQADAIESVRPTLLLLMAAAGLLLVITCVNVGGLLLTRAVALARETAVHVALGSGLRRLALQHFGQALFVSIVGALAGIAASVALVRVVISIAAEYVPHAEDITIDWRVLLFAVGLACLSSVVSSLGPLWHATRTQPTDILREGGRASTGTSSRRLSRSLVVAEIALAFTLLASSAVLVGHLVHLTRISPGFNPDGLLTFQLMVSESVASESSFSSSPSRAAYHRRLLESVAAIPGLSSVALANQLPLDGCCVGTGVYPEGRPELQQMTQKNSLLMVSPEYLRTMGIPLRAGRFLSEEDREGDLLSIVINETAARTFWTDANPVGAFGRLGNANGARFQIVGIVGDVKNDGLGKPPVPELYLSSAIIPVNPISFIVRSPLPPATLLPEIRRAVQRVEPAQPIHAVASMREIASESVARERLGSLMMTFFAIAALLMATLGVYGVIAYTVRQGTAEIGTRMALGATGRDVLAMFVRSGLTMALAGLAIGGVTAGAATRMLARAFDIQDLGWLPFVASTILVAAVATAASLVPAWRASLLSPMAAIRRTTA